MECRSIEVREFWVRNSSPPITPTLHDSITPTWMRSAVQRIDVSRAIELFEQAGVHKISRIGVLGGGDPCGGVLNDGPEAINGRIRLLWHHLAQCLIGIFDLLLVLGLAVLRERSLGKRRVGA